VTAAVVLSSLWPGLGQLYAGHRRRALLYGLPALLIVAGLGVVIARSPEVFALRLLVPTFAYAVVGLITFHGLWRVAALFDAWLTTRRGRRPPGRVLPLVLLLVALTVGGHGVAGYDVSSFAGAGDRMFDGDGRPDGGGDPLDDILGPGPGWSPPPGGQLGPTPRPDNPIPTDGPVNILFVGVDSGPGRDHALTDSLIVASFDPDTNELVMISVPRDTGRVPLFDGGRYDNRINSLMGHFKRNGAKYPDGPIQTLVTQMSYLVGVPIHYYAVTDMAGLREVVDLVGGVDVVLEQRIADPRMQLYMEPGRHHLDGERALMYARSRYGPGNSDFVRARRQQQLIRALANRAKDPEVLVRLPEVLDAGARLVRSDVPVEQLPEILELLDRSAGATTRQIVLAPPRYAQRVPPDEVGGRYMIELKMDALAALSVELFGDRSRYGSGSQQPPDDALSR
jgi:LCP family protein required for cell wall assembly